MKSPLSSYLLPWAACHSLFLSAALGQGVVNSGTISASTTLTNPAGAVVTRLTSPTGPRLRNHYVQAASNNAPPRAASAIRTPSTTTSSTLAFAVDATGSPSWEVSQRLDFEFYGEQLYFPASAPLALAPGGTIEHRLRCPVLEKPLSG